VRVPCILGRLAVEAGAHRYQLDAGLDEWLGQQTWLPQPIVAVLLLHGKRLLPKVKRQLDRLTG